MMSIAFILSYATKEMFSPKMKRVMRKILYITEVAILAEEIEHKHTFHDKKNFRKEQKAKRRWIFHDVKSTANLGIDGDDDDDEDEDDNQDNEASKEALYHMDSKSYAQDTVEEEGEKKGEREPKKTSTKWYGRKMKGDKRLGSTIMETTSDYDTIGLEKLLGEWMEPKVSIETMVCKFMSFLNICCHMDNLVQIYILFFRS